MFGVSARSIEDAQAIQHMELERRRLEQIEQAERQRRIKYLHGKFGEGAATKLNRLLLAKKLALLTATLGGGALGAIIGGSSADKDNRTAGALVGGALGAGIGGGLGSLVSGIGELVGGYTNNEPDYLKDRLSDIGVLDYVTPGRASYVAAQLEKDFLEHENDAQRPSQHVF